jgi:hypothetical protein
MPICIRGCNNKYQEAQIVEFYRSVGDTESGPQSDILGQAKDRIRTEHCLDFLA